ncbi:MAG: hypothetical protein JWP81_3091 [Ferruginibacter sp.]|nr:hypothetical protein [Ferruginibacter sp.]
MKNYFILSALLFCSCIFCFNGFAQTGPAKATTPSEAPNADAKLKSDAELEKKAFEWVTTLNIADPAKASRLKEVIAVHLKTIRDWNNEHPFSTVPAGINPVTGKLLSELDRQVIANSAIPKSFMKI